MNFFNHNIYTMGVKIHMNKLLKNFEKRKEYDDEKFKFVKYPNVNKYQYVISNYGRVFNYVSEKEKKCYKDKDGYLKTSISTLKEDGKRVSRNIFIHRLVAYTFLKKIELSDIVNHKDDNKQNNYYKNLEWTTPAGNTHHAIENNLQCNSGVNCPSAKYNESLIREICEMLENGCDNRDVYIKITGDDKINDRAIYALIYSIQKGTRHREIRSEYNIPDKIVSKSRPQFKKEEIDKIEKMLKDGYSSVDIIKTFGGKTTKDKIGKRIYDKILQIKKKSLDMCSSTNESVS